MTKNQMRELNFYPPTSWAMGAPPLPCWLWLIRAFEETDSGLLCRREAFASSPGEALGVARDLEDQYAVVLVDVYQPTPAGNPSDDDGGRTWVRR